MLNSTLANEQDEKQLDNIQVKGRSKESDQFGRTAVPKEKPASLDSETLAFEPKCNISFYPDSAPVGGGTILVWKMQGAQSGKYDCREKSLVGRVNSAEGQLKIKKAPKSLFCTLEVQTAEGLSSRCTAALVSLPKVDDGPQCSVAFSPVEIRAGEDVIVSWSAVGGEKVKYTYPELNKSNTVLEALGSRSIKKVIQSLSIIVEVTGFDDKVATCRANLNVIPPESSDKN
jgi:hypothetical protein